MTNTAHPLFESLAGTKRVRAEAEAELAQATTKREQRKAQRMIDYCDRMLAEITAELEREGVALPTGHASCTHPATKAARAACRRARA